MKSGFELIFNIDKQRILGRIDVLDKNGTFIASHQIFEVFTPDGSAYLLVESSTIHNFSSKS